MPIIKLKYSKYWLFKLSVLSHPSLKGGPGRGPKRHPQFADSMQNSQNCAIPKTPHKRYLLISGNHFRELIHRYFCQVNLGFTFMRQVIRNPQWAVISDHPRIAVISTTGQINHLFAKTRVIGLYQCGSHPFAFKNPGIDQKRIIYRGDDVRTA